MGECITTKMRNAAVQATALRQIAGDRIYLRLQFQCRDMATRGMREEACRPTQAGADVEYLARGFESKLFRRPLDGAGSANVPLIQREQLLRLDWIGRADPERGQSFVDTLQVRVEWH
jgi:hypothetical protein